MAKNTSTLLITGASSGIGAATVQRFLAEGWQVFATMRQPAHSTLIAHPNLHVLACDVTQPDSIQACVQTVLTLTDHLDVLVNNAGYGLIGPLELATTAQIKQQFDTNVFGLVQMMQAVLPTMRQQQHGLIVNVASIAGRTCFPLYSLYHGTKWAVEGISESAAYELAPHGIRIKVIEPGPIKTAFYDRSMHTTGVDAHAISNSPYASYGQQWLGKLHAVGNKAPGPEVVANTIWRAVTDGKATLRYPVNTMGSLWLRRILPEALYRYVLQRVI
jgi:NAD(P)-dependent dehydrogenase (short-subunit alcohol dehydrogenase family)